MRIVLDLQLFQGPSSSRGIGRYSLEHALEFINSSGNDEIFILMNDSDSESIEFIKHELSSIDDNHFIIISLPSLFKNNPAAWIESYLSRKNEVFELITESVISLLHPDFVLIYSYFEFIGSWNSLYKRAGIPSGIIIYDFIPYFSPDPFAPWLDRAYNEKINSFVNADLFFCISDFTSMQTAKFVSEEKKSNIFSIGSGKSSYWKKEDISKNESEKFLEKYSKGKSFVFYAGGSDERKNLKMLIHAWGLLDCEIRKNYTLLIACGKNTSSEESLKKLAISKGLSDSVSVYGYISDSDLRKAYSLCSLFVFPSLAEGFGLTPLEAMACEAPVISSDRDSLPYVIGFDKALFNPEDPLSISKKIEEGLSIEFNNELRKHSVIQSGKFSWKISAQKTIDQIRKFSSLKDNVKEISEEECISYIVDIIKKYKFNDEFLRDIAMCISDNFNEK